MLYCMLYAILLNDKSWRIGALIGRQYPSYITPIPQNKTHLNDKHLALNLFEVLE